MSKKQIEKNNGFFEYKTKTCYKYKTQNIARTNSNSRLKGNYSKMSKEDCTAVHYRHCFENCLLLQLSCCSSLVKPI